MADPEMYQDQQRWRTASQAHQQLKARLDAAYQSWENLQESA
jgi:hypothetical protein